MTLEYTLYGEPKAWSRAGSHGSQRFTPAAVRVEQARHREAAELARPIAWPLTGAFVVHVVAYLGTKRRPDVDNLGKLVMDGIQGVAFENDNLVERLVVDRRLDRDDPRTEVRVMRIDSAEAA